MKRSKNAKGTEPLPFEDVTLPDVIADVLRNGPLIQTEIDVCTLQDGYETNMDQKGGL